MDIDFFYFKMNNFLSSFVLWLLFAHTAFSQEKVQTSIDSLIVELSNTKYDKHRVDVFNKLSEKWFIEDYDTSLRYSDSALILAKQLKYNLGEATAYYNIGSVNFFQGDYPTALKNSYSALTIGEKVDAKQLVGNIYNTIGKVHWRQKNYGLAIEYYNKSINILKAIDDQEDVAKVYNNVAIVYAAQENYDKAIELYTQAFDIMKSLGKVRSQYIIYVNIGDLYKRKGDYKKAMEIYPVSLKVFETIGYKKVIIIACTGLGQTRIKQGYLSEGRKWLLKALDYNKQLGAKEYIKDAYYELAKVDSIDGDFAASMANYKMYILYRDSVINEQNTRLSIRTEMQYTFDKKQAAEKAEQEKKDIRQRSFRNSAYGAMGTMLFFSLLLLWQQNKVRKEKTRSDRLLRNILPVEVAEELKAKGSVEARYFDDVSILFTDFVNFTQRAEMLNPKNLIHELNEYFTVFDEIIERNGLERIKTIGDAYLAVCGLPISNPQHAQNTVKAALEIRNYINEKLSVELPLEIRIGINSGSVIAGIVGLKKFAFDIWGDTVNTAARFEHYSEPGKVNISNSTFELVKNDFQCTYRGKIETKGKGKLDMYFVESL